VFKNSGRCQSGINGPVVWPPSELVAIGQIYNLDQAEIQIIRDMSAAFLGGLELGSDPLAISPMDESYD
jgi:hypothetical protein